MFWVKEKGAACLQAPALCAPYLESALANGTASPHDHHNDLAGIYLRMLLNEDAGTGSNLSFHWHSALMCWLKSYAKSNFRSS